MKLQKKVKKYIDTFKTGKRYNGTEYVYLPLDSDHGYDEKLSEAVREAHGERFPDDDIYSRFLACLEIIRNYDKKTIEEIEEDSFEMVDSMVDVYTGDLTEWLNSDIRNVYYLTEVLEECEIKDGFALLAQAQYKYIDEIMQVVINLLRSNCD